MNEPRLLAEAARRRGLTYWLLAQCFAESPKRDFLEELSASLDSVDAEASLGEDAVALANALRTTLSAENSGEELAVEFTRLFGGISESYGAPPPYESVYLDGQWGGDTVFKILAAYAEADIVPPLTEGGPPDHLSAELRFLAIACHRESEAWHADDVGAALAFVLRESSFLDNHLLAWIEDYCREVGQHAAVPFYQKLLRIAPRACQLDREDVALILQNADALNANA